MIEKKLQDKLCKNKKQKRSALTKEKIATFLQNKYASYVLLTCSQPSKQGKMQAEMSYSGDETLVSYLVDNAMSILLQEEQVP